MTEVDYQMALLLQHKYDQERKRTESDHVLAQELESQFLTVKNNADTDRLLALELQEQFKTEAEIENPRNNLVYKAPKLNNSKCLVDPSWEVIDPTPDIHVLFMAFNERFFWNKLQTVSVSWSKRMTTCAGICSYQGPGGLCQITLSEPLLKLRPRKDLVETLLHEMIHAYLFVTHNNRDRDGHGPEFHKHMYRINAEAGTNISVYHDFHDEVRLYQQHWWRCNGPCQNWKPYFGMVRRAMNRPPGPADRWWNEHSKNCGGTYTKVKSPDEAEKKTKNPKKSTAMTKTNSNNDIRNYISTSSTSVPKRNQSSSDKTNNRIPYISNMTKSNSTSSLSSNIHSVTNNSSSTPQVANVISSKTSNIFGFTNLGGSSQVSNNKNKSGGSGMKGAAKNAGSSTFVVRNKGIQNTETTGTAETNKSVSNANGSSTSSSMPVFNGTGRTLTNGSFSSDNRDYSIVRNHWLKKFDNNNKNNNVSKRFRENDVNCSTKVPKIAVSGSSQRAILHTSDCPICSQKVITEELNCHLDVCLKSKDKDSKRCIICDIEVSVEEYEKHVSDCSTKHFDDVFEEEVDKCLDLKLMCVSCCKRFDVKEFNIHVKTCNVKQNQFGVNDKGDNKKDVNIDKTCCLACNKEIRKSELSTHLEDCINMSTVFDNSKSGDDHLTELDSMESEETERYNCPFCLELVLEKKMQSHLDRCLNIEGCSDKTDKAKEKSLIVESLICIDSDSD